MNETGEQLSDRSLASTDPYDPLGVAAQYEAAFRAATKGSGPVFNP